MMKYLYARSYIGRSHLIKIINEQFYFLLVKKQVLTKNFKTHKYILSLVDNDDLISDFRYLKCIRCNCLAVIFDNESIIDNEFSCDEYIIKNIIE